MPCPPSSTPLPCPPPSNVHLGVCPGSTVRQQQAARLEQEREAEERVKQRQLAKKQQKRGRKGGPPTDPSTPAGVGSPAPTNGHGGTVFDLAAMDMDV